MIATASTRLHATPKYDAAIQLLTDSQERFSSVSATGSARASMEVLYDGGPYHWLLYRHDESGDDDTVFIQTPIKFSGLRADLRSSIETEEGVFCRYQVS